MKSIVLSFIFLLCIPDLERNLDTVKALAAHLKIDITLTPRISLPMIDKIMTDLLTKHKGEVVLLVGNGSRQPTSAASTPGRKRRRPLPIRGYVHIHRTKSWAHDRNEIKIRILTLSFSIDVALQVFRFNDNLIIPAT